MRADIGPLPIHLRGVVHPPEVGDEIVVTHLRRIEKYLDCLGMPRPVRADFAIGRVFGMAADIAAGDIEDAGNLKKSGLDAPEAPGCKDRFLSHITEYNAVGKHLDSTKSTAR